MNFSFPKSRRIRKGWEFDNVFRTGTRVNGRLVRLLYFYAGEQKTRIGVVAGKRYGSAVFRNRSKRKLREAVRRFLPFIREGYHIVISLRTGGFNANSRDIMEDLGKVLQKCGLLDQQPVQ